MQEHHIRAGVSSACFFPMETLPAVRKLTEWKVPNIEIFFNSFQELKPDYLERLADCCRASQTRVVSVHPFTSGSESFYFFTDYPGRLKDGLELYRHFLRAARFLDAQLLVFHGASVFSSLSMEQSAEHFRMLDQMAREEYGVTVAYENVVRSRSKEPDYLLELKRLYPELACVLDVKQALRSGKEPMEYLEKLGDSIRHIHISDSDVQKDCLPVGRGTMDLEALFEKLRQLRFDGFLIQELYSDSYQNADEVLDGFCRLKDAMNRSGIFRLLP